MFLAPRIACALLILSPAIAGAATVEGVVFADLDGDGLFSAGDAPLPGVAVVWEAEVWGVTGPDGHYALTVPGAGIVWARSPDGFDPGPWWANVGAGGGTADLALRPSEATGPLAFVQASDTHFGAGGYYGAPAVDAASAADALAQIVDVEPRPHFFTITGDMTAGAAEEMFRGLIELVGTTGLPFVPVIGNHDVQAGDRGHYRQFFGPQVYSFTSGGAHVVVLDYDWTPAQIDAFLTADLASVPPELPIFALVHAPRPEWPAVYAAHGIDYVVTGHVHSNRLIDWGSFLEINTETFVMGGLDGSPAGFRVLRLVEDGLALTHHTITDGAVPFLAAASPLDGTCVADPELDFLAAAEAGTRFRSLTLSVDGGAEIPMQPAGGWVYRAPLRLGAEAARHRARLTLTLAGGATRERIVDFCVGGPLRFQGAIADWPQLQRDARHGGYTETTIRPPLSVVWTRALGGHARGGSPVVEGGRLFVSVVDPSDGSGGGVIALDARTGRTLWERRVGASVHGAPAVADGLVVFASIDGKVRAVDTATGEPRWEEDLLDGLAPMDGWLYAGPTISDGVVYIGHRMRFEALELATGNVIWRAVPAPELAWPGAHAQAAVDGDVVVTAFGRVAMGVVALDARTGAQRWRIDGSPAYASPILGPQSEVYLGGTDTIVRGVEPASGATLWSKKLVGPVNDWSFGMNATGALAHGTLFLPTMWDTFFALDADDGRVRWQLAAGPSVLHTNHYQATAHAFSAAPAVTGDIVWIGGADGQLRAVDAGDGHERWKLDLGLPILSGVVPAGCALYVASFDGTVRALAPEDEACGWLRFDPELVASAGCGCRVGSSGPAIGAPAVGLALLLLVLDRRRRRR